ncbi:UNVERIFIED_ORG: hypothetical protein LHK14_19415 [Roseateles sp. XES5]|nr:hypothetical protein [Roseateles sp. XES5]
MQAEAGYGGFIDRATIFSSLVPDRIGGPSSSQAADRNWKARRISSPGGFFFCAAPIPQRIAILTFVAKSWKFDQNFAQIYA